MDANNDQAPTQSLDASTTATTPANATDVTRKRSRSPQSSETSHIHHSDRSKRGKFGKGDWKSRNNKHKGPGKKDDVRWRKDFDKGKGDRNEKSSGDAETSNEPKAIYSVEFSKEEIAGEERRPKRKVAVMIGYCGSGYSGLQVMKDVKTVEGDLFVALVAAGAISKANADEPKKVQLFRCARTDKGVHAAGNVLSMKLIIEDKDIIEKINSHLPAQIRVWGVEQTINSFNAYQQCDSRIYEYLIPTHCFLPPHPESFLGKKLDEIAAEANDTDKYKARQAEVENFWTEAEERYVKPILAEMEPELREKAIKGVFSWNDRVVSEVDSNATEQNPDSEGVQPVLSEKVESEVGQSVSSLSAPLDLAIRSIKAGHQKARIAYRMGPDRLAQVKSVFGRYVGTYKYHNYTVRMRKDDPSSQRHIKSFVVNGEPFLIGDTEWISLKVHGQSFMMHQIRKMVLMATMIVRCGTHEARIQDSFDEPKLSIPRAPGMGLLLERPIFDAYNKHGRQKGQTLRGKVEFEKYRAEIDAFKHKEIYSRMWKDEAEQQVFTNLFAGLDSLRSSQLFWTTSLGVEAVGRTIDGAVDVERVLGEDHAAEGKPGGHGDEGE